MRDAIGTASTVFVGSNSEKVFFTSSIETCGNSSTPLGHKKHLKPTTPASINDRNSC